MLDFVDSLKEGTVVVLSHEVTSGSDELTLHSAYVVLKDCDVSVGVGELEKTGCIKRVPLVQCTTPSTPGWFGNWYKTPSPDRQVFELIDDPLSPA
ncbi:hypothetical protein [Ottowia sp.]|uniref:hypothetical protein n=1 Tax=Ottowia sp. TaxID=1898956 RepID=UPI0026010016|nr:hypothetical protein [Ottowia sp.]MBK6616357.1 hypothetical protein [Ottowia sp.]